MKHTNGEWYIHGDLIKSKWVEEDGQNNGCIICNLLYAQDSKDNAKLIAAAPNLLKNLQYLIDAWEDYIQTGHKGTVQHEIDKAKALIKAATE